MPRYLAALSIVALFLGGYAAAELQDPTRPSFATPEEFAPVTGSALRVNAIFVSGDRRLAIVNGRRLRVGDEIDGAIVSSIEKDRVSFVRGEQLFAVSLLSGSSRN